MSPEEEKTALRLFEYIRDDVKGAVRKVDGLGEKIDSVKDAVHNLEKQSVSKEECSHHHGTIDKRLYAISKKLDTKQTRDDHPVVPGPAQSGQFLVLPEENTGSQRIPVRPKATWAAKVKDNLATIITICTLIGIIGTGFYKMAHLLVKVEDKLNKSGSTKAIKDLKKEIKQLNRTNGMHHTYGPLAVPDAAPTKQRGIP